MWALDFRMSDRLPYDAETHRYTLDDIADYDHPAAIREIRRHIGEVRCAMSRPTRWVSWRRPGKRRS